MKAIANKPMLSKHVRTIRIVPSDAPGPWLTTSAFEKRLADERTLLGRDSKHLDITRDRDCMSEYVSHQGLYSLPHNARSEFLTTAEKILTNAVVSFFGLKRIVSGMGWPLFRYQGWRTERDDEPREGNAGHLREAYASLNLDSEKFEDNDVFDVQQKLMVLRAVERGRWHSRAEIDVSSMFWGFDAMIANVSDPDNLALVKQSVTNVKNISLYVGSNDFGQHRSVMLSGKFASFLALMSKLQSLRCGFFEEYCCYAGSNEGIPSIATMFGQTRWRNLAELSLFRFYASATELSSLFQRHRATIRQLSLKCVLLHEKGSWRYIFEELPGGVLQKIDVYLLSNYATHQSGIEFDNGDDDLRSFLGQPLYPEYLKPPYDYLEPSHPLHRFIVLGHEWVPDMVDQLKYQRVVP